MKVHATDDSGNVIEYVHKPVSDETDLEDYIEKNPEIIEKGLMILKRQPVTDNRKRGDLLGLDYDGNVVIIEIKKESNDARKVITQTLEYGIWAEDLTYSDLNAYARENNKLGTFSNLEQMFQNRNDEFQNDDFNGSTRMFIVHEKIPDDVKKISRWLNKKGINLYCVELNFHEKDGHKIAVKQDIVENMKRSTYQRKEEFSEEYHIRNGFSETREMYFSLRDKVKMFGDDVQSSPVKFYIGFKRDQNFLQVRIKQNKLVLTIRQSYDGKECFSSENTAMQKSRHKDWKNIRIHNTAELESCLEFIRQSYNANKK
jgi:predicted transport protein